VFSQLDGQCQSCQAAPDDKRVKLQQFDSRYVDLGLNYNKTVAC
jgi:hypothetical protein